MVQCISPVTIMKKLKYGDFGIKKKKPGQNIWPFPKSKYDYFVPTFRTKIILFYVNIIFVKYTIPNVWIKIHQFPEFAIVLRY